jgi:hypothetical protein
MSNTRLYGVVHAPGRIFGMGTARYGLEVRAATCLGAPIWRTCSRACRGSSGGCRGQVDWGGVAVASTVAEATVAAMGLGAASGSAEMMASGQSPLDGPPSDVTGMLRRVVWQASAEICVFSWCIRGESGVSTISAVAIGGSCARTRARGETFFVSSRTV